MAAIYETAYPRIKPNLTMDEIEEIFKPTEDELQLLISRTKASKLLPRLGMLMLLKSYQYLGRAIKIDKLPLSIKEYCAKQIHYSGDLCFKSYDKGTRKLHISIVRNHLGLNIDFLKQRESMKTSAMASSKTKEKIADIINAMIDELIKSNFELPEFDVLHRMAIASRKVMSYTYYTKLSNQLDDQQKTIIRYIIGKDDVCPHQENVLTWFEIKQPIKKPTTDTVRQYLKVIEKLMLLRDLLKMDISFIPPAKLEQLNTEAMALDIADMKKMMDIKMYSLIMIAIHMKVAKAIDEIVNVFLRWVKSLYASAKRQSEELIQKQAPDTDELILLLYNMLIELDNHTTEHDKIVALESCIRGKKDKALEQCRNHLKYSGNNHLKFMLKPYNNKRSIIYKIINSISIKSSTADKGIERALIFIETHRKSKSEWIDLTKDGLDKTIDLTVLSNKWHLLATKNKKGKSVKKVHKKFYELGVFTALSIDLNCGDAFVENSLYFDDPNKQFISWDQFHDTVLDFCNLVNTPRDRHTFSEVTKGTLYNRAKKVDQNYPENQYLSIENAKPVLKKSPKKTEPEEVAKAKQLIASRMPVTNIVDMLVDVENWVHVSKHFKPLSGYDSKIKDYPTRFVSTTFAYGCNIGPTQASRSILKFSRKQIAWLFNHHITEKKLDCAITDIINRYNLFELPKKWGDGSSVSVDGTFWDIYTTNLLAAHHIRYGKYGGIGYYHVSDQYIAIFSNFISCGAHESVYLLDGLVENDSDVKPTKVHGDSWAQSEVMFGLAFLLGISIMPRIKNFKHLCFYKSSPNDTFEHIDAIFTDTPVDWELIETHYDDMLRVAMSIQAGTVRSSTVLRKLCSKSRKNKLYYAFRELGRVVRTIFLLKYMDDLNCRQTIQSGTCKSEEFNEFIDWIAFGGGGVIGDNMECNQRKIIKFNHLVANMLIFHTVAHQTNAINTLVTSGKNIAGAVLKYIPPYWREHLNRFGTFVLNIDKSPAPINYGLSLQEVKAVDPRGIESIKSA